MSKQRYTTIEAAKMTGVPRATVHYWISIGILKAPPLKRINGKPTRLWTAAQIEQIVALRRVRPGGRYNKKWVDESGKKWFPYGAKR
jgi:DNA-binding transcriptional MerR regulator